MKKKLIFSISLILSIIILNISVVAKDNSGIVFSKSKEQTKKIALTFDDGPHPRYTEQILDILDEYDIKATFFVIGVNIENYPETLKSIYTRGHEIGNHSYDHSNEKNFGMKYAKEEILKCQELIYKEIGVLPRLFRPPQGQYSCDVEKIVNENNYSIVLWSIDTRDWEHTPPEKIMSIIDKNLSGGDIILMHDYTSGKNTTCDALELIIPSLLSKGYEFVTVSELMQNA